jgi:hypothetical protein
MTNGSSREDFEDFTRRVIPLLLRALIRRDNQAQKHGWYFEAIDRHESGYRLRGRKDVPTVTWRLLDRHLIEITSIPGGVMLILLSAFDDLIAEEVVAGWWSNFISG